MALKGKIYSLAKQREDIDSRNVFESMIKRSADQNAIVMDGRNLAAGSIFADQISAGAITTGKIKADAVTTDKIIAGAITTGHLVANSVTAEKISVDELSAITSDIGTITAGLIKSRDDSSYFNMTEGKFSFANDKILYDGKDLSISADSIDLEGKVTFSSFNNSLQTTVSDAKTKTDEWSWENTTEIDGGSIRTKTITTDQIKANSITSTEINVGELSSITSNIGTVNAGIIKSFDESIIINLNEGLITLGKPLKIQGKTVATEDDISSLGYGDIISKFGQKIFTNQAEDSAVHVEVDGQSYQHAGSGKNLLPISYGEYQAIQVQAWGTSFVDPLSHFFYLDDLGLKVGDTVTISSEIKGTVATRYRIDDQSGNHAYTNTSNYVTNGRLVATFKIAERTTEWFSVRYDNQHQYDGNTGGAPYNIEVKNQMIELGSTATAYEPSAPTPDYPIEIESVNDFDVVSSVGGRNYWVNNLMWDVGNYERIGPYDYYTMSGLKPNTDYTMSINPDIDLDSIPKPSDGNRALRINNKKENPPLNVINVLPNMVETFKRTVTSTEDGVLYILNYNVLQNEIGDLNPKGVILKESSDIQDWTPAPEDITPDTDHPLIDKVNLSLSEPLRSVGDVKDRLFRDSDGLWKVERNVGERELKESKGWSTDGYRDKGYNYAYFRPDNFKTYGEIWSNILPQGNIDDDTRETVGKTLVIAFNLKDSRTGVTSTDNADNRVLKIRNYLFSIEGAMVSYELATPTIETLDQELQDKLNTLKSFKRSNYIYTVNNTEDLPDQIKENLIPTLHATFKGSGWLPKYNAEQARIDLKSETNNIRNDMDNLVTLDQYNLNKGETDEILDDYQAAIDVARRELNGLVNEDGELILGGDGKPLQKGVINEVLDLLGRAAAVESDYGEHSRKLKFMDTQFVMGTEGMFIGDTETRTGIMISPRVEETTEHEARASRIDFLDNNRVVAYISSYMMEISRGIFVQSAQIGEHKIETIGDGHTTFQWTPK